MIVDRTINKMRLALLLAQGRTVLFQDDDIVSYLQAELSDRKRKHQNTNCDIMVVLVRDAKEHVHLVAIPFALASTYKAILETYLKIHGKNSGFVCGGGLLNLDIDGRCKIHCDPSDPDIGPMNTIFLKRALRNIEKEITLADLYRNDVATSKQFSIFYGKRIKLFRISLRILIFKIRLFQK